MILLPEFTESTLAVRELEGIKQMSVLAVEVCFIEDKRTCRNYYGIVSTVSTHFVKGVSPQGKVIMTRDVLQAARYIDDASAYEAACKHFRFVTPLPLNK